MNNNLNTSIISTLCFFDMFDYPLTVFEIWKYLYNFKVKNLKFKVTIDDVLTSLENNDELKEIISFKNGFYFLKGRERIVQKRLDCYNAAQPRWKKLKRVCGYLQIVPFLRVVAACNTLAINNVTSRSDIDVFVITKHGKLWMTRFFVTLIVWLLGEWRHGDNISGKICLSFFVTDKSLNLKKIAQKPYDIYLSYWISLVFPIYDLGVVNRFFKENKWVEEFIPNSINFEGVPRRFLKVSRVLELKRKIFEFILRGRVGDKLERFFKKTQLEKMKKIKDIKRMDSSIIVSDEMLKFHEIDRRRVYREEFERKLHRLHIA